MQMTLNDHILPHKRMLIWPENLSIHCFGTALDRNINEMEALILIYKHGSYIILCNSWKDLTSKLFKLIAEITCICCWLDAKSFKICKDFQSRDCASVWLKRLQNCVRSKLEVQEKNLKFWIRLYILLSKYTLTSTATTTLTSCSFAASWSTQMDSISFESPHNS